MIRCVKILAAIVILSFHSVAFAADGVRAVTLTWTNNPKTTQTISWQTSLPDAYRYLEYGPAGQTAPDNIVRAETSLFATEQRDNFIHTVYLQGLQTGTEYDYRIGDGTTWVKMGKFITEGNDKSFKFLLFSDSQSYDYKIWQKTFETAYSLNRDAAFYAVAGDLVDNGQKQQEWDGWFAAVSKYAGDLSVVPVVGNHETYTPQRKFSLPRYFVAQFKLPQNGPVGLKSQVYSFDFGDAHFVVLDTQFGEERSFIPDSLQRQQAWLDDDLTGTDKAWKIVLMHRPVYHNRLKEQTLGAASKFMTIFDEHDVDVAFSGHDHVVARTEKLKAGQVSPRGTVYAPVGRSGTKTYDTVGRKSWNVQFLNPVDQPVYYVVSVEKKRILVKVFQCDGTLIDEWQLIK